MLLDQGQQTVFRNRIEVAFQVRVDHVNVTFLELLLDDAKGIMSTRSMTKAEAPLVELVVQNWFEYVQHRPLDDAVADRRNAQWSCLIRSSRFGNVNSTHRSGAIGLGFDFFGELSCFHEQMLFERLAAVPINSGRFPSSRSPCGRPCKDSAERKPCQSTRAICLLSLCFPKVSSTFGPSKQQAEPTGECPASLQSV